jgi:hypothetical protein
LLAFDRILEASWERKGKATGFSGKKSSGCCGLCVVRAIGVGRLMEKRLREYDRWRRERRRRGAESGERRRWAAGV